MHLHVAGPLRCWARLLAGVLTCCALAVSASALPSEAATGSVTRTRVVGPTGVSASEFGADFAVMAQFEPLAKAGQGTVAVVLPGSDVPKADVTAGGDTAVVARALRSAGVPPSRYVVQSAGGSDATQYADVVRDVSHGARVIVLDPINSGVGAQIEAFATSHRIPVVDYDSLTPAGSRSYEVGFDPVQEGKLMGRGLVDCAAAWHVAKAHVVVLEAYNSDGTAARVAKGYDEVLHPLVKTGRWTTVSPPPGTVDTATEFRSILSAHHDVNAALIANPETGPGIVTALKSHHTRPKAFPAAGLGATVPAVDDILTGYLCGTVYEPVVAEAQAAVALALYVRAGALPPRSLVNGTTEDATAQVRVPSVVLPPVWVTARNIKSTVVRDGTVRIGQLCAGRFAAACAAAGISQKQRGGT